MIYKWGKFGMPKVIKITDTHVFIGMDDGSFEEYDLNDLNFVPHIGDEVEIFRSDVFTIVTKRESGIVTQNTFAGADTSETNTQSQSYPKYTRSQGDSGTSRSVNKVMYCMLAVLLGGIGAHKFFAGKTGAGVCYILFCWTGIQAIIAMIDFIVALFMKPDANGEIYV